MIDPRPPFPSAVALVLAATVSFAAPQGASRSADDAALRPLAEAFARYRAARARGAGTAEARAQIQAAGAELAKAAGGGDYLAQAADLARAQWLSWSYEKAATGRGSIEQGEHRGGAFAAQGLKYAVRLPKTYDPARAWPLVVTLPEEGETPADHLRTHWLSRDHLDTAILLAPAMPARAQDWDQVMVEGRPGGLAHLLTAQRIAVERFAVDPDRVFLVGRGKGVTTALAAGDYSPQRFAGIVGWAGDAGALAPDNFQNLPTLLAGGSTQAQAFRERAAALGFDNCTVSADVTEESLWRWIATHARDPWPARVRIVVGDPFPTRVHWLRVAPTAEDTQATAAVDRAANRIDVTCSGTSSVALFLSDALVDLGRPVTIVCNGESKEVQVARSLAEALDLLEEGIGDPGIVYTAQHVIELNRPERLDPVATGALELGDPAQPTAEEARRLAAGWVRQDLEWIRPEEAPRVAEGLWRVEGEWLDLAAANRRRGAIHSRWCIPSRRLIVHSTASREVALRAMSEMQRALSDLERVFGCAPEGPIPVAVLRDEEQYDRLAFGDPDGRRPPTHVARMHIIHRGFFAESWFEPVDGTQEFRGMGVCYWDTFAPFGDRYGVHAARLAVGLSFVDALDPSPKAVFAARKDGPSPGYYAQFRAEKMLPEWLRFGGAVYAERYYQDTSVGPDGDRWWTRKWSLENLVQKGGLRPLPEIFAFPANPDARDDSLRLYIECGLLVAFLVDGGCAPLQEPYEKLKRSLERGSVHPRTLRALEEALVAHEAELRTFAGL